MYMFRFLFNYTLKQCIETLIQINIFTETNYKIKYEFHYLTITVMFKQVFTKPTQEFVTDKYIN